MPTLRRSAFNQGGSWVADPWDTLEAGNRSAQMQSDQQRMAYDQNNALTAAALARLKSEDYRFAQSRVDNKYMFDQDLQARNHSEDRRYDYMDKTDLRADARDDKNWTRQTDPTANPWLRSQMDVNDAQGALAKYELEKRLKDAQRADDRPDPTFADPNSGDRYRAKVDAGVKPSQAKLEVDDEDVTKATAGVGVEEDAIGNDLRRFSDRDNSYDLITGDPSESAPAALAGRLAKLEERLRVGLKLDAGQARERANNLVRKNTKQGWNSGSVDELMRLRQMEE